MQQQSPKPHTEAQVVILMGYDEQPALDMISHNVPNGLLQVTTNPSLYYTLLHFYSHGCDDFILLYSYREQYEKAIGAFLSFLEQIGYNYYMSWTIRPVCYKDINESVHALHKLDRDGKLSCDNVIVVRSSCLTTIVPSLYLKAHRNTNATMTVVLSDVVMQQKEKEKIGKCKNGCFTVFSDSIQHNPPIDLLKLSPDNPEIAEEIINNIYQEILGYNSIHTLNLPRHKRAFETRYLPFLQLSDEHMQKLMKSLDAASYSRLKEIQAILVKNIPRFSSFVGTVNYFQLMNGDTKLRIPFSAVQDGSRMRAYSQPPGIIVLARELIRYLANIGRVWSLFNDLIPFLVEQQNLPPEAQHPNLRSYLRMSPDINLCLGADDDIEFDGAQCTPGGPSGPNSGRQDFMSLSRQEQIEKETPTMAKDYEPLGAQCFTSSFAIMPTVSPGTPAARKGIHLNNHLNKELLSNLKQDLARERMIKSIRRTLDEEIAVKSLSDKLKPPRRIIVTGFELTNEQYSSKMEQEIRSNNRNFPAVHCLINSRDVYLRAHLFIKDHIYTIPAWIPQHRNHDNLYFINYSYNSGKIAVLDAEKERDITIDNVMFKGEHRRGNPYGPGGITTLQCIESIGSFNKIEMANHTTLKASVIGPGCKIGEHVYLNECILGSGVVIHEDVVLKKCIVLSGATVRKGCKLEKCTVLNKAEVPEGTRGQDVCYRKCQNVKDDGRGEVEAAKAGSA